jgi:hypothetical protein
VCVLDFAQVGSVILDEQRATRASLLFDDETLALSNEPWLGTHVGMRERIA